MSEFPLDRFQIVGGSPLVGEVKISGAKNSILKLMAVTLMAPGNYTLRNVPDIADVSMMGELLTSLGCSINRGVDKSEIEISVPEKLAHRADY
ncbi:MAG: UDP-N-acetylglucosamine 1-carboxyvinyltransferase, partial [Actinobacteria bacterium]|nr:UDP-N-acetylglucosamine 1-carboxyvinyltransferase [Actinomycetota bacterium]